MKACTISSNHSCARTQAPDETISLVKFFADITIIILLGIAILLLALYATPFRRGFFCDDDSIRFPHKQNTIPSALVGVAALGLPIIVITMSELVVYRIDPERRRSKTFFKWAVPLWIRRWCHAVSVFLFGAAVTKLLVDSAKYTLGRLRPHFLNVCLPDVDCNKPDITQHDYIDNYECTGSDMELIKDARMSFPSGHAALAFYSATFTILYLEQMMTWRGSSLLRHTIQAVFLLAAWMTALSRMTDFMHHWSDVVAGMALGIVAAFLMILWKRSRNSPEEHCMTF
ncbi:putative phosphatidate phosphatase isoform X2 [Anabrus simplex]|uniref:putative phosphatidate phosphatase isoform X2 n=1 Tax=Anabrus simplex TaxID=316456 RepID=UPI0034DD98F5